MLFNLLQVALGGAIGASLRYLSGVAAIRLIGPGFPWATLFVNVVGSLMMGVLAGALAHIAQGNRLAPFLMTGLLGGFTTFSAFSLDAVNLWERGQGAAAGGYVMASVVLSIGALLVGLMLVRSAA